ncbi:MAG: hypothetical protein HDS85_06255 [Bacteroidales bacterium]|nr:hypothetical protein [Bacteroidales bacterium]
MIKFTSNAAKVLGVALMAVGSFANAWAEGVPETSPSGFVNLKDYGEGVNGVVVMGQYTIDRNFDGCVSMYRDDVLVRQLPASNTESFYTFYTEGLKDVYADNNQIQLIFDRSGMGIGSIPGEYKIVFPAGIVYTNEAKTETNPEWTFNITCGGLANYLIVSPEADKSYESLQTFTLTLPDSPKFRWGSTSSAVTLEDIYGESIDEDHPAPALECAVSIEGNVATVTTDAPITRKSTYFLNIPSGFYMVNQGTEEAPEWQASAAEQAKFYVREFPKGVTIEPSNEESIAYFPATVQNVQAGNVTGYKYVLWEVKMESTLSTLLKGRPAFYALDEDGNITGDPVAKFATATDPRTPSNPADIDPDQKYFDGHSFYVISEEFADGPDADPDLGNFLPGPGNYALVFPAGTYAVTSDGKLSQNAEFQVNFTVGVNPNFPANIKPTDGYVTNDLQYFTVTFDEGVVVEATSRAFAHLTNGVAIYAMTPILNEELSNVVDFALPIPMKEEGTWTFTTPPSGFTVNGMVITLSATYTVKEGRIFDTTMAISPAPGKVSSLQVFNITFPGEPTFPIGQEGGKISLTNEAGEEIAIPVKYPSDEGTTFILDLETPIVAAGNYALTIAPNTLWVGGEDGIGFTNLAETFYYQVDGSESVEGVEADNAPADLYNAAGMVIARDVVPADLNGLAKGLYIYKGKKFVVK